MLRAHLRADDSSNAPSNAPCDADCGRKRDLPLDVDQQFGLGNLAECRILELSA